MERDTAAATPPTLHWLRAPASATPPPSIGSERPPRPRPPPHWPPELPRGALGATKRAGRGAGKGRVS